MKQFKPRQHIHPAYEIPLFVWLSFKYNENHPGFSSILKNNKKSPHQTDRLIYGMLDLLDITYHDFPENDNLFSKEYQPRTRYTHENLNMIYQKN